MSGCARCDANPKVMLLAKRFAHPLSWSPPTLGANLCQNPRSFAAVASLRSTMNSRNDSTDILIARRVHFRYFNNAKLLCNCLSDNENMSLPYLQEAQRQRVTRAQFILLFRRTSPVSGAPSADGEQQHQLDKHRRSHQGDAGHPLHQGSDRQGKHQAGTGTNQGIAT